MHYLTSGVLIKLVIIITTTSSLVQSQSAAMPLITCCVEQIRQNQRWTVVWTACDTGGRWLLLHLVVIIVLPLPVVRQCRWCLHANTLQTVANFLGQHHAHSVCLTWKETSRCVYVKCRVQAVIERQPPIPTNERYTLCCKCATCKCSFIFIRVPQPFHSVRRGWGWNDPTYI